MDWWNIKAEHTPYEWACQVALYSVCPFGERRADMRAAVNSARLIAAQSMSKTTADDFIANARLLQQYLKCEQDHDEEQPDLDALQRMKDKLANGRNA
jgi:hypothetical protein